MTLDITTIGLGSKDYSLSVGSRTLIAGPNWSGKTTVLGLIALGTRGRDDQFGAKAGNIAARSANGEFQYNITDGTYDAGGKVKLGGTKEFCLPGYDVRTLSTGIGGSAEERRKFLSDFIQPNVTTADAKNRATKIFGAAPSPFAVKFASPLGSENAITYLSRLIETAREANNEAASLLKHVTETKEASLPDRLEAREALESAQRALESAKSDASDATTRIAKRAEVKNRLQILTDGINRVAGQMLECTSQMDGSENRLKAQKAMDASERTLEAAETAAREAGESARDTELQLRNEIATISTNIDSLSRGLQTHDPVCPTCTTPLSTELKGVIATEVKRLRDLLEATKKRHADASAKLSELRGKFVTAQAAAREAKSNAAANRARVKADQDSKSKLAVLQGERDELNIQSLEIELPPVLPTDETAANRIAEAQIAVDSAQELLDAAERFHEVKSRAEFRSKEFEHLKSLRNEIMRSSMADILAEMKRYTRMFDADPVLDPGSGNESPQIGVVITEDQTGFVSLEAMSGAQCAIFQTGIAAVALSRSKAPVQNRVLLMDCDAIRDPAAMVALIDVLTDAKIGIVAMTYITENGSGRTILDHASAKNWDVMTMDRIEDPTVVAAGTKK